MSEQADLFPGFSSHWVDGAAGRLFARAGGFGPALLLLHGFPQTHVMWHKIAGELARLFRVVAMDLRGYGWSSSPGGENGENFSKRKMAEDAIAVMSQLGHMHFSVAGHDRGARVGYRLALDHPGRIDKLAILDIVPTADMWAQMDADKAISTYHWLFLAQKAPLPEKLIASASDFYLEHTLASWTADHSLKAFDPRALQHYRSAFSNLAHIHACCEDYRAGAGIDRFLDEEDRREGKKILCPMLALWGKSGIPAKGSNPLALWRGWADDVKGQSISGGHFLAEENPAQLLAALEAFL